jgi:hypothetical protein
MVGEVADLADPVEQHLVGCDQVLRRFRRPAMDLDVPRAECGRVGGLGFAEHIVDSLRPRTLD